MERGYLADSDPHRVDQRARRPEDPGGAASERPTVTDVCRKHGISEDTFYRWRERHDPAKVDDARRVRELEGEVERLKRLVAELDKQMLQVAKKVVTATQQRSAADHLHEAYGISQRRASRVLGRARSTIRDAKAKAYWWRRQYNEVRPHSGLAYKTPKEFSAECDRGLHGRALARKGIKGSVL